MPGRNNAIGKYLTELRRSHAAGMHDAKPTRTQELREAINMSILDGDYADIEPTPEQLAEIEEGEDLLPEDEDMYPVNFAGDLDEIIWIDVEKDEL